MGGGEISYKDAGVNYTGGLDQFKKAASRAAWETETTLAKGRFGFEPLKRSRGGSVFLSRQILGADERHRLGLHSWSVSGHLVETLGTKSLVADAMYKLTGDPKYYRNLPQDAVAMIVNDAATGGVVPQTINMLLEVGSSNWFKDIPPSQAIIKGWRDACIDVRCVWGGGETSVLKGLLYPDVFSLSGSATGISLHDDPESFSDGSLIQEGDAIVFVMGNGIHANGLSLARAIATRPMHGWKEDIRYIFGMEVRKVLPDGYLTKMNDGRTFGEALLDPTPLYSTLVEDCLLADCELHYAVNITGHGLRKLMRPNYPFAYMVDRLPPKLPIFESMQKWGPISDKEAYETFNMGPGYALYVPPHEAERVITIAKAGGFEAYQAGNIYTCGEKRVSLPNGIEWGPHDLSI